MRVTKRLRFCAAHRLLGYEGKCAHLHGHNYVAEVSVDGEPDGTGMVADFGGIKRRVGGWIDEHWDHAVIGNVADMELCHAVACLHGQKVYWMGCNPTAENMAEELRVILGLDAVKLWETDDCCAEVP